MAMRNCRRRLDFGPSNTAESDDASKDLSYLTKPESSIGPSEPEMESPESRFNFDFANDRPMPAKVGDRFEWKAKLAKDMPSMYSSTSSFSKADRRRDKSPTPVTLPLPSPSTYFLRANAQTPSVSRVSSVETVVVKSPQQLPRRRHLCPTPPRVKRHRSSNISIFSRGPTPPAVIIPQNEIRQQPQRRVKKTPSKTRTPSRRIDAVPTQSKDNRNCNQTMKTDVCNVRESCHQLPHCSQSTSKTSSKQKKFQLVPRAAIKRSTRRAFSVVESEGSNNQSRPKSTRTLSTPIALHTRSHHSLYSSIVT